MDTFRGQITNVPSEDDITVDELIERSQVVSRNAGDGTLNRDVEVELQGMVKMAQFVVQSLDLRQSEVNAIARRIEDQRTLLNRLVDEIEEEHTGKLME